MSIALKHIVSISKGKKHSNVSSFSGDGKRRYIQIEDLRNDANLKYTDEKGVEVLEKDLIIAWDGANAGTIGFGLNGFIGSTLARLRIVRKDFDSNFLGWFLRSKFSYLRDSCTGATIPHINKVSLESLEIPEYGLQTQKRIASILGDADSVRQQRKAANVLTEQFLQSSFLHLFGDPIMNEKVWKKRSIKSLATKYSDGPFGSNLKSEHYSDDGVLVIRLENIGVNQFKDSSRTYIPLEHYKKLEKHSCFPGDVIIGTMGEPNLRACILPNYFNVAINKADCVLFRPDKNLVLSQYVSYLLNTPSFVKSVSNLVLGQTRGRISMGRLSTVEIPVPPLPVQQHFASIVANAEILRQKQQESEKELEHLFQALLQQYFGAKGSQYSIEQPLSLAAEMEVGYGS